MHAATVGPKGQVTIPAKLRRNLGIKPGTRLIFEEKENTIIVRPITVAYIKSLQGILATADGESWTEEIVKEHKAEVASEN